MKYFSHLNTAVQLIGQYKGEMPFSIFLKSFFAQHKKYGSKDRKSISHLCYCYFRLGKALQQMPVDEKILIGLFLCDQQPNELLQQVKPGWNDCIQDETETKIEFLNRSGISFSLPDIFPWKELLSDGIDHEQFCRSFLIQPDLFLRLRPGHERSVKNKLEQAGIAFKEISSTCLALPNASKIDSIIDIDKEAVVQDLNSQNTGSLLTTNNPDSYRDKTTNPSLWDCCAASGGKSILAYDLLPGIQLTVSDIRDSIIHNLKQRFSKAGIKNYNAFVEDLSTKRNPTTNHQLQTTNFHLILLDAPCSGSGTWSRTPEQLACFQTERINHYSTLQRNIASNVISHLSKDGRLIYITCSVFKEENEDAVEFISNEFNLRLERMELLEGYNVKADTLFAASFVKE